MVRTLRISTGLILFAFVGLHLINISLGLISLEVLDESRRYFMAPWSNPVGGFILAGSMAIHLILGLVALYRRNTFRMPPYDAVQFVSALLIVPLLLPHVLGVTLGFELFNNKPSYYNVLQIFWVQDPMEGLRQVLIVAAAWIHGCIGVFTWLRLKRWWLRVASLVYPLAVAIPVLALLGFVEAGNQVIAASAEAARASYQAPARSDTYGLSPDELYAFYLSVKWSLFGAYGLMVVVTLVARAIRLRGISEEVVELHYQSGPVFTSKVGTSLLEMAQLNDLPHANICRGRGRCGTCRVRIVASTSQLPPPTDLEQKTLDRFNSPDGTRLACQIVPGPGIMKLHRLLPPDVSVSDLREGNTAGPVDENRAENLPAAEPAS